MLTKRHIKKTFAALLLISTSLSVQASLVATDWQNQGDHLATLDTISGIEWLDLSQTIGMSVSSAELALSSTYLGWRVATTSEVLQLYRNIYTNAVVDTWANESIINDVANYTNNILFNNMFGNTYSAWNVSYGKMYSDNHIYSGYQGVLTNGNDVRIYNYSTQPMALTFSDTTSGVYLINDGGVTLTSINDPTININNSQAPINAVNAPSDVPVSGGVALFSLALLALRKRR